MRRILHALAFAGIFGLFTSSMSHPAAAQALGVNCDALSGTTRVCIKNASHWSITSIMAVPGNGAPTGAWVNIPGGFIPPGGTTIVNFPAYQVGTSIFTVWVRTATGTHPFGNVNIVASTGFIVSDWR